MPHKFLVVDDNADSRFLLTKTLLRKFPTAVLVECADDGTAITVAESERVDAIVVHRTAEVAGLEMLPRLRAVNAGVPIVMVSGVDRSAAARQAGADYFLLYEEWLRIGTTVAELLMARPPESLAPFAAHGSTASRGNS